MPIIHSYPQTPNSDPSLPQPLSLSYLDLTLTPQFNPGAAQTRPSLRLRLLHGSLTHETL